MPINGSGHEAMPQLPPLAHVHASPVTGVATGNGMRPDGSRFAALRFETEVGVFIFQLDEDQLEWTIKHLERESVVVKTGLIVPNDPGGLA